MKQHRYKGLYQNGKSVEVYATKVDHAIIKLLDAAVGYWDAPLDIVYCMDTDKKYKPLITITYEES